MVKIGQQIYKICFIPYSTTLLIKKQPPQQKPKAVKDGGVEGLGVGLTAFKDSKVLFKGQLVTSQCYNHSKKYKEGRNNNVFR